MARYRQIKRYAGMLVIKLSPTDEKDLNIKEGDYVDVEDAIFTKSIPQELKKSNKK